MAIVGRRPAEISGCGGMIVGLLSGITVNVFVPGIR